MRIHESTVSRHLKNFIVQEKLTSENGGSESHLSAEKPADLIDYLTANLVHTTTQVVPYVRSHWQVPFSEGGMTKWLHCQSFNYKKPK
ncbi:MULTISPECIES: hypothetical protein [Xenorhabdus]|uniref:winged helix-turn-helix domain-containing protein n=1 Tax=Xenorhabdus TaxID=626 RepID=UPI000A7952DC|nr:MULTISPECIES: hypothetical protein [Xenorhabdus]